MLEALGSHRPDAKVHGLKIVWFNFNFLHVSCAGARKGSSTTSDGLTFPTSSPHHSYNLMCSSGSQAARTWGVSLLNRAAPLRPGGWGKSALALSVVFFSQESSADCSGNEWNVMGQIEVPAFSAWTRSDNARTRDSSGDQDAIWTPSSFCMRSS